MIGQHYKIPASAEMIEQARPGQFVFDDSVPEVEDYEVCGFVDFLSDDRQMGVMLFEPMELPGNATMIAETCDWESRLREIIAADPLVAQLWEEG
jgi:hypothetical protein